MNKAIVLASIGLFLIVACGPLIDPGRNGEQKKADKTAREATPSAASQPASRPGTTTQPAAIKDDQIEKMPGYRPGMDAQDLGVMLGRQKVAAAEARMRELRRKGLLTTSGKLLSFKEISNWEYLEGLRGMPKDMHKLAATKVTMLGFMLPIDQIENMTEFILVESLWACCFGSPPDTNGMVRVVLQGGRRQDFTADPIAVEGVFHIKETMEEGFCVDIYQLHATVVKRVE